MSEGVGNGLKGNAECLRQIFPAYQFIMVKTKTLMRFNEMFRYLFGYFYGHLFLFSVFGTGTTSADFPPV